MKGSDSEQKRGIIPFLQDRQKVKKGVNFVRKTISVWWGGDLLHLVVLHQNLWYSIENRNSYQLLIQVHFNDFTIEEKILLSEIYWN